MSPRVPDFKPVPAKTYTADGYPFLLLTKKNELAWLAKTHGIKADGKAFIYGNPLKPIKIVVSKFSTFSMLSDSDDTYTRVKGVYKLTKSWDMKSWLAKQGVSHAQQQGNHHSRSAGKRKKHTGKKAVR